jgi:transposase
MEACEHILKIYGNGFCTRSIRKTTSRDCEALCNKRANITLLASLSLQGMGEAFILEGSADATVFEVYIERILAPSLQAGQIVVMDNLSTHTGEKVQQALLARGCQLLFLPSYSPDLSPIEEAFSKLKAFLRHVGARTPQTLQEALGQALLTITTHDALGWFTHCGYRSDPLKDAHSSSLVEGS